MPNALFNQLGGGRMGGAMGQMQQMITAFQEFKANFKGDPQQEVQNLLNSGRMTQEQYNELQQMANQMSRMMGR